MFMKKILSLMLTLALVTTVFVGSAWAKPAKANGQGAGKKVKVFSDIEGHWAKSDIHKIQLTGLVGGYEDGTFRPNNLLTQAEAAVLIDRITSLKVKTTTVDEKDVTASEEVYMNKVPSWARKSVLKAAKNNVINLKRFHSQEQCTRLMACVQLAKVLKLEKITLDEFLTNPFKDSRLISDDDYGYILALYKIGIIKGSVGGNFNPNSTLKRAEIAVIMVRLLEYDKDTTTNIDATAPEWPSGSTLTATNISTNSLDLNWTAASDNKQVTGYKIILSSDGRTQEKLVSVTLTAKITELVPETKYTVTVEARDAAGNWSTGGPSIEVTTKAAPDTAKPTWSNGTITSTNITDTSISVSWSGDADNVGVTGYKIYVDDVLKATIGMGVKSTTLLGLTANTRYKISIEAGDAAGNWSTSGPSIEITTN
jgi:chitodextrinase